MIIRLNCCAVTGIDAHAITTEVHLIKGAKFHLVGLPDSAMKEASARVFSAIINSGFRYPGMRITINMSPADIPKEGASYDLPMTIGILACSGQCQGELLSDMLMMGELSLDGSIQPIKGVLSMVMHAKKMGLQSAIIPFGNKEEAALVEGIEIYPAQSLRQVVNHLNQKELISPLRNQVDSISPTTVGGADFSDVKGQESIKRALEIAAAGGHNILMVGPPGAGKTMLARRVTGILPEMDFDESIETTRIHSVASKVGLKNGLVRTRPFRSPHHSVSDVALVGGGSNPQPGEISMAHNGVLFLDELPEFKRGVLEVLRQPMEEGLVTIARAKSVVDYPARFILIAAMNPCPCGFYNHPEKDCTCSSGLIERYLSRISGPLMDRIDMHLEVVPVPTSALQSSAQIESSSDIRDRVNKASQTQKQRFENKGFYSNSGMGKKEIDLYCQLDRDSKELLLLAMEKMQLSARAYDKILKVARTIADLDKSERIEVRHLSESIQYRSLDRSKWGN